MRRPSYLPFSLDDIDKAIGSASNGREKRKDVKAALKDRIGLCNIINQHLTNGEWPKDVKYRQLTKINNNGKVRHIDSPDFTTLVYEHLLRNKLFPIYMKRAPLVSLNCKEGCGITPSKKGDKKNYVLPRIKHLFYDLRQFEYCVCADQRQCYAHIKPKVFRKELKKLIGDKWLIDFAVRLCFVNGRLPIGTPMSPLVHHILMLSFHRWLCANSEWRVCYADNCLVACRTREEALQIKWRIRNYWWYEYGLRAKMGDTRVFPIEGKAFDFCGYKVYRNHDKGTTDSNKGYCHIRRSTLESARNCTTNKSWGSYFGLMRHADCFREMQRIEKKMKLSELTKKVKINRHLDAPNIQAKELARNEITFNVYDYELRNSEKTGEPNWIKMLIGIPECVEGRPTGRIKAFECHGGMAGVVAFMAAAEKAYGKQNILPIEDVTLIDQCGFIFKDSTNQINYINN